MRMISASLALLALVAAEPAFAGCGSHGGGYSGGHRSRVAKAPIVVKKVAQKLESRSSVRTAAIATADKPEVTSSVGVTSNAVEPAKPAQSTAALACKEYSAALGDMITVPCS